MTLVDTDAVVREWQELCRWDPTLPPDSSPPIAVTVVEAVADAVQRPQPIGWGADPALANVAQHFATSAGGVDVAVAELVCLREAFRRHVADGERVARVDMLIDRAICSVARASAERTREQLSLDPVTGLPNRAAYDRDVEREVRRANRYQRPLSVVVTTVVGLDAIDADRHGAREFDDAADAQLRRVASVLVTNVRAQDGAYRVGAASLSLLLAETNEQGAAALVDRLNRAPMPPLAIGAATYPSDAADAVTLLHEAEARRRRTLVV